MRKLIPIFILLCSYSTSIQAQNYNCLQSGVKPFYTNGNGYLRGMRIDSVRASGSDTIFYPYHTPRYRTYPPDSTGNSWLGKKVIKQADGTFLFDDMWHDTVVVKTQALLGDTWTFYNDTTNISYKATVTAIDTMTVLGTLDSVKKIKIEADTNGVMNIADPVNHFTIILSKHHGFVQIFDLYTFPYHIPGDLVHGLEGYDYYYDLVLGNTICNCDIGPANIADTINSIFHLVPFHDPTLMEVYNFSIGEVLEFSRSQDNFSTNLHSSTTTLDTILSKTIASTYVTYTMAEATAISNMATPSIPPIYSYGVVVRTYDTTKLIDTTLIPEEWNNRYFYHFFPKANYNSADVCPDTVCIVDVNNIAYPGGGIMLNYDFPSGMSFLPNSTNIYGIGFGLSRMDYSNNISMNISGYGYYIYANNNGDSCGTFSPITNAVPQLNLPTTHIDLFPNPAHDELTINASGTINEVVISNLLGQIVYSQSYNTEQVKVDISALQTGVYFIKINGSEVRKFMKL